MKTADNILIYMQSEDPRWDEYVFKAQYCTIYHLAGWRKVIEESFGHPSFYVMSLDGNGVCNGILPLVHMRSRIFGNFVVSLPFLNYGGPCAESSDIIKQLVKEGGELAERKGASFLEVRSLAELNVGLIRTTKKVSMRLDLPGCAEDLWNGFPSKLRSQIKRPLKAGMTATIGRVEELDAFYHVFSRNMRDLGTPVYSKSFFGNVLRHFPEFSRVCIVYDSKGDPIASGIVVGFKGTLEIPWASSLRRFNQFSPNMLVYWAALKYACDEGYSVFDFGRSTPGEGTFKFKEQWGARPVQMHWYYWLRRGSIPPDLSPKNPRYSLAIKMWKTLPVALTTAIGPFIVRNIP